MDGVSDEGRAPPALVDDLPDELLLLIFSQLPVGDLAGGVGGTSRRWRALSRTSALWRRVEAVFELQTSVRSEFCRLVRAAPALRTITIKNSNLSQDVVAEMLGGVAAVRGFHVAVPLPIDDGALVDLLQHYAPHLQELSLHLTAGPRGLWDAISSMESLRVLRLSAGQDLHSDELATGSSTGCPALRVLDLEGMSGASRIPSHVMELLRVRGHQLEELVLPRRTPILTDAVLGELSSRWSTLESLGAGYECIPFLCGAARLTALRLWYEYCDQGDACFAALRSSTPLRHLRRLTLEPDGTRLKFAGAVLRACSGLRELVLKSDTLSEDGRLGRLLHGAPPGVRSLTLRLPLVPVQDVVEAVRGSLPNLSWLDVRGCWVRDESISEAAATLHRDLPRCSAVIADR